MPRWPKKENEVAPENTSDPIVPRGTVEAEVVPKRKYSADDGTPFCLNCNHREDMHHDWKEIHREVTWKNPMTGQVLTREVVEKQKVFDRAKPCQHACKCWEYK